MQKRRRSALGLTLLLAACSSHGRPGGPQSSAIATPGLAALHRPLRLPAISPGAYCPVSAPSRATAVVGVMLGNGPARPVGIGPDGVLVYVAPGPGNIFDGSTWGGNKVLWAVAPGTDGDVLVRGHQLDGPGGLGFGLDLNPGAELVLPAGTKPLPGGWRDFPSTTRLQHPGCYAYQVDTASASNVVVFVAR